MPMTEQEERISYLLGDKSGQPVVGMSRRLNGVAFSDGQVEVSDNLDWSRVLVGVLMCSYRFDLKTASWIRQPGDLMPSLGYTGTPWGPEHEAALERLRDY